MRHKRVNHAEVDTHVSQALAASWAGVVVAGIFCKAVRVHEVSTSQFLQALQIQDQIRLPLQVKDGYERQHTQLQGDACYLDLNCSTGMKTAGMALNVPK